MNINYCCIHVDKLNELHDELVAKERRSAEFTEVN